MPAVSTPGAGRRRCRLLLLLVLVLPAAACQAPASFSGQRSPAPTSIAFASNGNKEEDAGLRRLLDRFEEATKARIDLGVVTRFRDESGIKVKLIPKGRPRLRMLSSGQPAIHLFAEDIVALRPLVQNELVQSPDVDAPPGVDEKMVDALRFDGRLLFLPFRRNVRLTYANKGALLEAGVSAAPRDLNEFRDLAVRLRERKQQPMVTLSLSDEEGGDPTAVTISELILGQGGDPRVLNSEASIRAFEFLRQCWQGGLLARESLFAKHDTEVDYLSDGVTWLAQNWSFTSSELAKEGELGDFEVYPGWQGAQAHVIGGDALGIPRGVSGKERDAAVRLATFLMSAEAQKFLARENSWPSILTAGVTGTKEQAETFRAINEAMRDGWYRPTESYWKNPGADIDMTTAMNRAVARAVIGSEPVRAVLEDLHNQVQKAYPGQYPPRG